MMSVFNRLHGLIGMLGTMQIFFIGGSQKSGTTWLQLLLDAHPQIACKGEGHIANDMAQLLLISLDKHNQKIADKIVPCSLNWTDSRSTRPTTWRT